MTTAKKTLFAAIGAGGLALDKVREIPTKAKELPQAVTTRVSTLKVANLRDLPKTVQQFGAQVPETATRLVSDYRSVADKATSRATKVYTDLSKRGEKVVTKVRKSAPTKKAVAQTKTAKSKVKGAATSTRKAAEATVEAAASAVETATEQVG